VELNFKRAGSFYHFELFQIHHAPSTHSFHPFCPADSHSKWSFIVVTELQETLGPRIMSWCGCLHFLHYCSFVVVAVVQQPAKLMWLCLSNFQSENYRKNLGNVFSCFWTFRANVKQICNGDAWTTCLKFNFMWSDLCHAILLPFHQVLPVLLINFMVIGKLCSWLLWWTRLSL